MTTVNNVNEKHEGFPTNMYNLIAKDYTKQENMMLYTTYFPKQQSPEVQTCDLHSCGLLACYEFT